MSKQKSTGSSATPSGPRPAGDSYDLGEWASGEGTDLTNSTRWQLEIGPRLGQDISAGKGYGLETGQKVNDVAVPNLDQPIYHIDFKVQESDPKPKTILSLGNVEAKIQVIRYLEETLGRLVPVLILNPMGLRPAIRRDNPSIKGLWLRYRVVFLVDDGMSESVTWKEIVLEGVMTLLLTDDILDYLKVALDAEIANIDQAILRRKIDEIEVQLFLTVGKMFVRGKPQAKSIAFGKFVTEAEPEVQDQVVEQVIAEADATAQTRLLRKAIAEAEPEVRKQVIQNAITEAEPEMREGVLATLSVADLEAELARRKASASGQTGK